MKPDLEIIETAIVPNRPFYLDDIAIGTTAARPEGEGWVFVEFLIDRKATRWVRRRPARLPKENPHA